VKIIEREKVCLELLGKLPKGFVLIGGYAISSFDFPRFSVDLDLVVPGKEVEKFKGVLENEGFHLVQDLGEFGDFYKGRMMRFEKKVDSLTVGVDMLINMIQARQTDTAYSFEYLLKNSELRRVIGSGAKNSVEARVANKEMLIALKINSMRMADQRDIISLYNGKVEVAKVESHLKRAPKEKILKHFDIILATLDDPKSKDSLKGVFGISDQVYKRMIDKARREILSMRESMAKG
jgi:hypothetical protein